MRFLKYFIPAIAVVILYTLVFHTGITSEENLALWLVILDVVIAFSIIYYIYLENKGKKLFYPLAFAILLFMFGLIMKTLHWPGARIVMISGFSLLLLVYVIRFSLKKQKDLIDHMKLIFMIIFPAGLLFTLLHLPYAHTLVDIGRIVLFVLIGALLYKHYLKLGTKKNFR